jgi:hypothetical protein
MKYFIILTLTVVFIGCGSGGSSTLKNVPSSPQTDNDSNTPPQVPDISK